MKRLLAILAAFALVAAGTVAFAATATKAPAKAAPSTVTVKGEIVDMGCYLGKGAHGEKHKECAMKCASEGMPLGLLTDKGKLYLLTPNHDDADPFTKAKGLAGSSVEVSGTLMEKNGVSGIDVASVKELAAAK